MQFSWVDTEELYPEKNKRVLVMIDGENPRQKVTSFGSLDGSLGWIGLEEGESVTYWAELPVFYSKDVRTHSSLNAEQQNDLLEHLLKHFRYDEDYAYFCFESILVDIENYLFEYRHNRADISEYEELSSAANDAYDLYVICKKHPSLETYISKCNGLATSLRILARSIENELKENKRPGRPTSVGPRNKLINEIYGIYPNGKKGTKSLDSHFEQLIDMVLNWIEPSPPDSPEALHQAINRAIHTKH